MNKIVAVMTGLALMATFGCESHMRGGGPTSDVGFRLNVPSSTQDIRQGEIRTVTIRVNRGEFFKQDVNVIIHEPAGLRIEPNNVMVRASDPEEVAVRVSAAPDTAVGTYHIRVTGEPQDGASAAARFTVRVSASAAAAPATSDR